jgi:hypothetical protein
MPPNNAPQHGKTIQQIPQHEAQHREPATHPQNENLTFQQRNKKKKRLNQLPKQTNQSMREQQLSS